MPNKSFTTTCPRCKNRYLLKESLIGRRTVCRICKLSFHLLPPPQAAVTNPLENLDDSQDSSGFNYTELNKILSRLDLRPGQLILDHYEVIKFLGQGGMSQVYKIKHCDWQTNLALKIPRLDLINSKIQKSFLNEAALWINLGLHPNIATCHYVRSLMKVPVIFIQYAAKGSLNNWIKNKKNEPGILYHGSIEEVTARILDIAIQAAWGLSYAHQNNVLHLDIKPHNLLLTEHDQVLVTDFGLAQALGKLIRFSEEIPHKIPSASDSSLNKPGFAGTPQYFSPERIKGENIHTSFDLWGWSLSLLEMFWGGRLWEVGSVAGESLKAKIDDQHRPPLPMPTEIRAFLERCLNKDAKLRPQSAQEAAQELIYLYEKILDRPYLKRLPLSSKISAASLNNQAVSFLDLELIDDAKKLFIEALKIEPSHLESTYNYNLWLWRQGLITDEKLLNILKQLTIKPEQMIDYSLMKAQIHLERGAPNLAEEITKKELETENSQKTLGIKRLINELRFTGRRHLKSFGPFKRNLNILETSPDGAYAALVFDSKQIEVWQTKNLSCKLRINTSFEITNLTLNNYDQLAMIGFNKDSKDSCINFYSLIDGHLLHTNLIEQQMLTSVILFKNKKNKEIAVMASQNGSLQIMDLNKGEIIKKLHNNKEQINKLSASHDGERIAALTKNNQILIWNSHSFLPHYALKKFHDPVNSFCLGPKKEVLVASGKTLLFFNSPDQDPIILNGHLGQINNLSWLREQEAAISTAADGTLRLWDLPTKRCIFTFNHDQAHPLKFCILIDNAKKVITWSENTKSIHHWNINAPLQRPLAPYHLAKAAIISNDHLLKPLSEIEEMIKRAKNYFPEKPHLTLKLSLEIKKHSNWLEVEGALIFWQHLCTVFYRKNYKAALKKELFKAEAYKSPSSLSAVTQSYAVLSNNPQSLILYYRQLTTKDPKIIKFNFDQNITTLYLERQHHILAVGGEKGDLWLFDTSFYNTNNPQHLKYIKESISRLAIDPGGKELFCFNQKGSFYNWKINPDKTFQQKPNKQINLKITPDSPIILSPLNDILFSTYFEAKNNLYWGFILKIPFKNKKIKKWPLSSKLQAASFDPLGEYLALGLKSGEIIIINPLKNQTKVLISFNDESNIPSSLAYSPCGKFLACAYENGKINLKNLKSKETVDSWVPYDLTISQMYFDQQASFLTVLYKDGTIVKIILDWELSTDFDLKISFQKIERYLKVFLKQNPDIHNLTLAEKTQQAFLFLKKADIIKASQNDVDLILKKLTKKTAVNSKNSFWFFTFIKKLLKKLFFRLE